MICGKGICATAHAIPANDWSEIVGVWLLQGKLCDV